MNKLKVFFLVGTVYMFCAGLGFTSGRQPDGEGEGKNRVRAVRKGTAPHLGLIKKLDLTENQKERLRTQKHQHERQKMELQSDLRLKQKDLRFELSQKELNDNRIDSLVSEIAGLQREILLHRVKSLKEFKAILTDEQWEELRSLRMFPMGDRKRGPERDKE